MRSTGEEAMVRALDAALAEFARYGLAGGRVDRISAAAGVSKERLYAYFGSKQQLWTTVMTTVIVELDTVGAVDSLDGAAITGRLFDHFLDHPDQLRLFHWNSVEEQSPSADDPRADLHRRKTTVVARAQRDGVVDPTLPAETIVNLMITVAATCAAQCLADPHPSRVRAEGRAAAVEVGARILQVRDPSGRDGEHGTSTAGPHPL